MGKAFLSHNADRSLIPEKVEEISLAQQPEIVLSSDKGMQVSVPPTEIYVDRYIDKIQYVEVEKEVIKEVQVLVPKIEYVEKLIEKEVIKEVEVVKEVIKEVEKEVIIEVEKIMHSKLPWILLGIETLVLLGIILKEIL